MLCLNDSKMKGPLIIFLAVLLLGAFWVGSKAEFFGGGKNITQAASATEGLPLGAVVTVQFRRNILAGANQFLVPPTTTFMNGSAVSITGTLVGVSEEWIVVKFQGKDHWVVRDTVMLVIVNNQVG
jgi:hypothetical protein